MTARLARKLALMLLSILLSATLQSCGLIEILGRGFARLCEQPVFHVSKTDDANDGVCTTDDCSLREAVITANACPGAQTIEIPTGVYTFERAGTEEDAADTGDLDITDDVRIEGALGGAGVIIDADGLDRVFHILSSADDVTITGVTIQNGSISLPTGFARGGGVLNEGGLSMSEVTLRENQVEGLPGTTFISAGGGIFNLGDLNLVGTVFEANQAISDSGGYGGGLFNAGDLVGSEVRFERNFVDNQGGGFANEEIGSANLGNSNFVENDADKGGGIANDGELVLDNVTVTGNTASTHGGGIWNQFGRLDGDMLSISGNHAGTDGGGVHNWGTAEMTLRMSSIDGNSADNQGGGLYNRSRVVIEMSSVTNNSSSTGTTAIYQTQPGSFIELTNVTVSGNSAAGLYSTILNDRGEMRIASSTIAMNSGGGIASFASSTTTLLNTILSDNGGDNCPASPLTTQGFNIDDDGSCALAGTGDQTGIDPLLQPLVAIGTPGIVGVVHPLDTASPAVDAGAAGVDCPATDQRGVARPQGAGCEIGAYELAASGGAVTPAPTVEAAVASPTPPDLDPIEINFNADSYAIAKGECTRLRWDVKNAENVTLDGQIVPALEAEEVCPPQSTRYSMVASNAAEEVERFVLIEVSELARPNPPGQLQISGQVCTDQDYDVTVGWVDNADNEEGYRVYRDGNLLATLGKNAKSYTDHPPYGGPYTYGVEAFNSTGASDRPTVQEGGCIY